MIRQNNTAAEPPRQNLSDGNRKSSKEEGRQSEVIRNSEHLHEQKRTDAVQAVTQQESESEHDDIADAKLKKCHRTTPVVEDERQQIQEHQGSRQSQTNCSYHRQFHLRSRETRLECSPAQRAHQIQGREAKQATVVLQELASVGVGRGRVVLAHHLSLPCPGNHSKDPWSSTSGYPFRR